MPEKGLGLIVGAFGASLSGGANAYGMAPLPCFSVGVFRGLLCRGGAVLACLSDVVASHSSFGVFPQAAAAAARPPSSPSSQARRAYPLTALTPPDTRLAESSKVPHPNQTPDIVLSCLSPRLSACPYPYPPCPSRPHGAPVRHHLLRRSPHPCARPPTQGTKRHIPPTHPRLSHSPHNTSLSVKTRPDTPIYPCFRVLQCNRTTNHIGGAGVPVPGTALPGRDAERRAHVRVAEGRAAPGEEARYALLL